MLVSVGLVWFGFLCKAKAGILFDLILKAMSWTRIDSTRLKRREYFESEGGVDCEFTCNYCTRTSPVERQ